MIRSTAVYLVLLSFTVLLFSAAADGQEGNTSTGTNDLKKRLKWMQVRRNGFQKAVSQMREGQLGKAEQTLKKLLSVQKSSAPTLYNLACVYSLGNQKKRALAVLRKAVRHGMRDPTLLRTDADLDSIRGEPAFDEILEISRRPIEFVDTTEAVPSAKIKKRKAVVKGKNTVWDNRLDQFRAFFQRPDHLENKPVRGGSGTVSDLLNKWYEQGTAAGNVGDLYDNRDNGHSRLSRTHFRQVPYVTYSGKAKFSVLAQGFQRFMLFNRVTFGNASLAITKGSTWRSLARMGIMQYGERLYHQYMQNQIYMYPEHNDHDGDDTFPANTPYMIVSKGSSGSDQPFLRAVASTLAAFRPSVKQALKKQRALMPAVQMLLRRSNKNVSSREAYLSGRAHPSVFNRGHLDVETMVRHAHRIKPGQLPPVAGLELIEEDLGQPGVDYFAASGGEKILTTPSAIGRVFRSTTHAKTVRLSAAPSRSINGGSLSYHWVVLRGDQDRVTITPQNEEGSVVEVRVPWHEMRDVKGDNIRSPRVDVGLFVENEHHLSAPAFLSVYCIPNEKRTYGPDDRIQSVDYAHKKYRKHYTDPRIAANKNWRDTYEYTDDGRLIGWTRHRDGKEAQTFTRHGAMVIERDDRGRPVRARNVQYNRTKTGGSFVLQQNPGNTVLHYAYDGPDDPRGEVVRRTSASADK